MNDILENLKYEFSMNSITSREKSQLIDLLLTEIESLYNQLDRASEQHNYREDLD